MKLLEYIKGDRKGREAHDLEREAMLDPLLHDALEGLDSVAGDHERVIEDLERRIALRLAGHKHRWHTAWYRVASAVAVAVVVLTAGWGIYLRVEKNRISRENEPVLAVNMDPEPDIVVSTVQEVEIPEVTAQDVQVLSDFIKVVKSETRITTEYDFAEFGDDFAIVEAPRVVEEMAEEMPIFVAEQMPSFRGGDLNTFRTWVLSQIVYPRAAQEANIVGKVVVKFVIETDGRLTNIEVISSPDKMLTDEAVRVLKLSPLWTPGMSRNRAVRVYFIMPIQFSLTTE